MQYARLAHRMAFAYEGAVNDAVAKLNMPDSRAVAGSALLTISHDAICLHMAIKDLVCAGWAFAAPLLLRTMLEGACHCAAITQSNSPNLSGFKYLYFRERETVRHKDTTTPERWEQLQINLDAHLPQLSPNDRAAAKAFMGKAKVGEYWFSEEYGALSDVIRRFGDQALKDICRELSDAAHFGYIGMRLFRDKPDVLEISPRTDDARSIARALAVSSRLLAELTRVRAIFEGMPVDPFTKIAALTERSERLLH